MKEFIKIKSINKNNNKFNIEFEASNYLKKFFNIFSYYVEYDFNIENIPDSILVISFLCNILPISWITNSDIILEEIDEDFYFSIKEFKKGYINMYPSIKFYDTEVKAKKVVKNRSENLNGNSGCFFSGGVDAVATLFSHISETPLLITVWGADIKTDNLNGWNRTKENIKNIADLFNLKYQFIKSNFKEFLNSKELNKIVENSNDKWWHGFQHGIGLIGLSSVISFHFNLNKIYIAASYTIKDKVSCASYPTIDNYVRFCNTVVVHDLFELNRQEKIEKIIRYTKKVNKYPYIHVCWESDGGENCCLCEKCCRTIMGIYAANGNPQEYGFSNLNTKNIKKQMYLYNNIDKILVPLWNDIINYYRKDISNNIYSDKIEWLNKFNPTKNRTILKKIFRKGRKILYYVKSK